MSFSNSSPIFVPINFKICHVIPRSFRDSGHRWTSCYVWHIPTLSLLAGGLQLLAVDSVGLQSSSTRIY